MSTDLCIWLWKWCNTSQANLNPLNTGTCCDNVRTVDSAWYINYQNMWSIFSWLSSNSESVASELLENHWFLKSLIICFRISGEKSSEYPITTLLRFWSFRKFPKKKCVFIRPHKHVHALNVIRRHAIFIICNECLSIHCNILRKQYWICIF